MSSASLEAQLRLPVIGSPMFIVSGPDLVIAQCMAGILGTMPSLSVRPQEEFEPALIRIRRELDEHAAANPGKTVAPFGINLIAHRSNARLEHDLDVCVRQKVPLIITSLGPSAEIVAKVHAYGGKVFHDVINLRHARKAAAAGVDGLILVAAGAGGHAGTLSPFALVGEVRQFFAGTIVLSGSMSSGRDILAALAMGADIAYIGSRFIATTESDATPEQKAMVVGSTADDIVYTSYFTGVHGNYLKPAIRNAGLDPDTLGQGDAAAMSFVGGSSKPKPWKDIWSAGQGVGSVTDIPTTAELVDRMEEEFRSQLRSLGARYAG